MTWQVHSKWLERMFDGTEVMDLDATATPSDIRLAILSDITIDPDTVEDFADVTEVATGTGYTGAVALANESCALNGSNNLAFDADDPATFSQDGSGFTDGRSICLYKHSGTPANDYILASHIEGSTFSIQDGDITITFDAAGIWVMTI